MKILVGISGASGVELGFCLLNALEKFTQNDELDKKITFFQVAKSHLKGLLGLNLLM